MRSLIKSLLPLSFLFLCSCSEVQPESGYRLWLRYDKISDNAVLAGYRKNITGFLVEGSSPLINSAGMEMKTALPGLLGKEIPEINSPGRKPFVVAGVRDSSELISSAIPQEDMMNAGDEGFIIRSVKILNNNVIIITANSDRGVLYGTFHFLRLLQTHSDISLLNITEVPKTSVRILNHWDNLDRSVERGYAGLSLWDWDALPDTVTQRYTDYARANASIGINSTVLTNVNANARVLTAEYLRKVAALADAFRPYGIKVYLTARFSAPVEIGKLKTSDPLDDEVITWWRKKAEEIYSYIPDFGGFTVKANSEGQPGPQNYGRSHADGANMLADALAPFGGIVMWRAFVYDNNVPVDRAKQAYNEFVPLDGKFRDNVLIQVKNGPIDFQPREPFHPLFGAMPATSIMPELQITQEYLGASVHLVYLAPLFEECLKSDTYARGEGSTVASVIDGTLFNHTLTAMSGVTNIGSVENWTGHPIGQANWYAFGRLAWDPYENSETIADEWIRMTFTNHPDYIDEIKNIMMSSWETAVKYMTPLGLHHIMYEGHHYGPGPWVSRGRQDWTSVYYHRADTNGLGFDRTETGSNAVSQYFSPLREIFNNIETCPENLLMWFHHVPWDHQMKSGRTMWEELCIKYHEGVNEVIIMREAWEKLAGGVDEQRHKIVSELLVKQERDARIWRDACILYFQTFSHREIPSGLEKPENPLDFYVKHRYKDIPGIR